MDSREMRGFTVVELLVILGVLALVLLTLFPTLARSNIGGRAFQCLNNHRQLAAAWRMYAGDYNDLLVASESGLADRVTWYYGSLNFLTNNSSNWDTNGDMTKSPLWSYVRREPSVFKCPADASAVIVSGEAKSRVRSYSMNSAFGRGEFLAKRYDSHQSAWRTYSKGAEIVTPAKTFLFADEHPDSINDSQLYTACTGAQPGDSASGAQIIDFPASWHNAGCGFSFADGRCEVHKWLGTFIQPIPTYTGNLQLNVPAGDSFMDVRWLAANTTVKR